MRGVTFVINVDVPNELEQWPEVIREAAQAEAKRFADMVDARVLQIYEDMAHERRMAIIGGRRR